MDNILHSNVLPSSPSRSSCVCLATATHCWHVIKLCVLDNSNALLVCSLFWPSDCGAVRSVAANCHGWCYCGIFCAKCCKWPCKIAGWLPAHNPAPFNSKHRILLFQSLLPFSTCKFQFIPVWFSSLQKQLTGYTWLQSPC